MADAAVLTASTAMPQLRRGGLRASASGPGRRTAGVPPSRRGCSCCRPLPADPKRQRGSAPPKSIIIGICSTETSAQSASSSSARIIGSEVLTPCPISAPVAPITTRLSGSMRIRTPSGFSAAAAALRPPARSDGASTSAPEADIEACRKSRRETTDASAFTSCPYLAGRARDGAADAHVSAAAAQVRDRIDVRRRGIRVALEQRHGGQHLARLAVAALRHVLLDPGLLHRMQAGSPESLDGRDAAARPRPRPAAGRSAGPRRRRAPCRRRRNRRRSRTWCRSGAAWSRRYHRSGISPSPANSLLHPVDGEADAHAAPMLTPMRAMRAPPRRGCLSSGRAVAAQKR